MNKMPPRYCGSMGDVPIGSVPVSVIILTKDEEINIRRCLDSAAWANQIVVIDCGSTDTTVRVAEQWGAHTISTTWRGYGAQKDFALNHPKVRHDWVYFLDADEWVSRPLAQEIAGVIEAEAGNAAYSQQFRLIFQGRWIAHCGWYPSVPITRLHDRRRTSYGDQEFSEHPIVDGAIGQLKNDIIDEDLKGLAAWLNKHVRYADLEAQRRQTRTISWDSRGRSPQNWLKYWLAPRVPARPLIQFFYMFVARQGFRDGRQGLLFCLLHAWFQLTIQALMRESAANDMIVSDRHQENKIDRIGQA